MTDNNSNILDLTSYFNSSDPLNENTCYFKAYQNLSQTCLEPYKKELDKCKEITDPQAKLGCEIKAQQDSFKCIMYKILSDSKNYTYNHCSGQNLPIGSKYTEEQQSNTTAATNTNRLPPPKKNYQESEKPFSVPVIPTPQPFLKSLPEKRTLKDKIFTIFRKKQD